MFVTAKIVIIGLLVLGILVLVHEIGHFLAAKACGIRVLAFSIGFGKPLLTREWEGTEYRISAIPFGGYVHMAGEHPEDEHERSPDEFTQKPIWQRATVAIAGPIANYLFSLCLLWVAFMHGVDRDVHLDRAVVGDVVPGTPAAVAGMAPGDSIASINGAPVADWNEVQEALSSLEPVYELTFLRESELKTTAMHMPPLGSESPAAALGGLSSSLPAETDAVEPGSAASQCGLLSGDVVISIGGEAVHSWHHMSRLIGEYDSLSGPLAITVARGDSVVNLEAHPRYNAERERYLLGISPKTRTRRVKYGPTAAVPMALASSWDYATKIFDVVGKLVSGRVPPSQLAGPVGIVQMSGQIAVVGLVYILNFMAFIGVNLAVLNLMPLVITDGGLLVFLFLEALRGRPLSLKYQLIINRIAIFLFIALFLYVTFNDIGRVPKMFRMLGH